MTAPALSLAEIRGPVYPLPGSDGHAAADYVRRLYQDGEQDALARYKLAARHLLFFDGRQHIDWSGVTQSWRDAPLAPGEIRTSANYIRPILRSRLSRVLSADFVWRAIPRSNADEDRDRATVAEQFLRSRWDRLAMDNRLRMALGLAFCSGVAYLKQFWNHDTGPMTPAVVLLPHPATGEPTEYPVSRDGTPLMDPQGAPLRDHPDAFTYRPGDTDSAVRSIFNVRMNPDAHGLEPAEGFRWLIDADVVPLSLVRARYGSRAAAVSRDRGGAESQRMWQRLVRSVADAFGPSTASDSYAGSSDLPDRDTTLLAEYWEAPSEELPEGRLIVTAGWQLLHDGPLPQGFVPYVPIYDERRAFDANGRSLVQDLVPPQRMLNRMLSLIQQELRAEGTGQWYGFDVPGLFDQLTNEAGAHIRIPMTTQTASLGLDGILKHVPKASINPAWVAMYEEAKRQLFDIGAFHEIQRGQVPPGVDSGIAVQLLQEAENAQLHDTVRTVKESLKSWGRQHLALARWGYGQNEARWLPVQRDDLDFLLQAMTGADLPDPDTIDLDVDGFEPASKAAFRADIKDLMDKQLIDARTGLELLDLGRGVKGAYATQTRHYAKARMENLAFEKGEFTTLTPPGEGEGGLPVFLNADGSPMLLMRDDDHLLHVERHNEIALDVSKPWPLRQAVLAHIEAHRQAMQMLTMEAAAMQASLAPQEPNPKASPKEEPARD